MNVLYTMDLSDTSPTATESPADQTDTWQSDSDRQIPEAPSADDEEGLLSDWTIVVFTLTTTALLFYHMTGEKTVRIHRKGAAFFACSLIFVALLYNVMSMTAFIQRTQAIIDTIHHHNELSNSLRAAIRKSQVGYGILTSFISVLQIGLVLVVIQTSIPELGIHIPGITPPNWPPRKRKHKKSSRRKY